MPSSLLGLYHAYLYLHGCAFNNSLLFDMQIVVVLNFMHYHRHHHRYRRPPEILLNLNIRQINKTLNSYVQRILSY